MGQISSLTYSMSVVLASAPIMLKAAIRRIWTEIQIDILKLKAHRTRVLQIRQEREHCKVFLRSLSPNFNQCIFFQIVPDYDLKREWIMVVEHDHTFIWWAMKILQNIRNLRLLSTTLSRERVHDVDLRKHRRALRSLYKQSIRIPGGLNWRVVQKIKSYTCNYPIRMLRGDVYRNKTPEREIKGRPKCEENPDAFPLPPWKNL